MAKPYKTADLSNIPILIANYFFVINVGYFCVKKTSLSRIEFLHFNCTAALRIDKHVLRIDLLLLYNYIQ